jgi:hypothetical protein
MRKLRDIVEEVMLAQGLPATGAEFMRYYQLGIDGLRQSSQQTGNPDWGKKVVTIPINEAGIFPMPNDFVDYYYVGICVGGTMVTLIHSPNMCPPMTDDCGDFVAINRTGQGFNYVAYDIYDNVVESQWRDRGHFAINWENRYFIIERDGLLINEIKLVYKSSINQIDGDFWVYEHDEWPVKAGIYYGLVRGNTRVSMAEKAFQRQEFINAKRIARRSNNPIRINEVLDAIRR